jgi:uncharacterized membrane protein (DUF2068 family)
MSSRGWFRAFGAIYALLAVSNCTKPLEMQEEHGLVFFGARLHGTPNLVVAPLLGVYLAVYAYGLWKQKKLALPLGVAYALYVPLNMYLFTVRSPDLVEVNSLFGITYIAIALGVSWSAAFLVVTRRSELS